MTKPLKNRCSSPHFSQEGEIIVQNFGFTGNFLDERNNRVYSRVQKVSCRFKELARIRHSCEKCGLAVPISSKSVTEGGLASLILVAHPCTTGTYELIRVSLMVHHFLIIPVFIELERYSKSLPDSSGVKKIIGYYPISLIAASNRTTSRSVL